MYTHGVCVWVCMVLCSMYACKFEWMSGRVCVYFPFISYFICQWKWHGKKRKTHSPYFVCQKLRVYLLNFVCAFSELNGVRYPIHAKHTQRVRERGGGWGNKSVMADSAVEEPQKTIKSEVDVEQIYSSKLGWNNLILLLDDARHWFLLLIYTVLNDCLFRIAFGSLSFFLCYFLARPRVFST